MWWIWYNHDYQNTMQLYNRSIKMICMVHGTGWFWSWWHNMIIMMIATIMVFDGWQARHPLVRYYGPTCLLADQRLLLSYRCDTDNGDGGGDDVDGDHHHHHNPSNWLPLMRIVVGKLSLSLAAGWNCFGVIGHLQVIAKIASLFCRLYLFIIENMFTQFWYILIY